MILLKDILYFPIRRREGILLYITLFPVIINLYFIFTVSLKSPLLFPLFPISRGFVLLIWRDFFLVFIFPELGLERYISIRIFSSR